MFLKTEAGPVYYEAHGPAGGPAIVFTHGVGLNHAMFAPQVAALESRCRVVTWDMPGHGESVRLEGPLKVHQMPESIVRMMDELGLVRAVLAGHSLGSWICQDAAVRYPERVTGLVSISGQPADRPVTRLELALYRAWLAAARLFPGRLMSSWVARSKAVTPAARQYAFEAMTRMGKEQFLHAIAGMLETGRYPLSRAPVQPLLIVHGEHEMPKSVARICREWHEAVPGSRYAVLPGAGHNCSQDRPEEFTRVLLEFLSAIARAGP